MSDPEIPDTPDPHDSAAMRALLKRSLAAEPTEPAVLLRAVQKKIRQRSKGKFYSDGWSTSEAKVSYALIAVMMLVLIAVVYFALGPTGIAPR